MKLMAAPRSGKQDTPAATVAHGGDSEQTADVVVAEIVVRAVLRVPAVAALDPGRGATAATYGRQRSVKGVVVRHSADGSLALDVHIVVEEAATVTTPESANAVAPHSPSSAVLPRLAETIRKRVARALREAGLRPPASLDIYFDDLV